MRHDERGARWEASRPVVQSIIDALPQHIAVLDHRGQIVATNTAWRRFGRENGLDEQTASCLGTSYLDVCEQAVGLYAEEARAVVAGVRAAADGRRAVFELEYPCPSATEERWFLMRVIRFELASQSWLVVTHENITTQRLTERAARESAVQQRLALEATDLGTWDHDLISGHISWDARCRAIFGAASDLADLDQALAIFHPDEGVAAGRAFETTLASDASSSYDVTKRIVRPDGTWRWISAKGQVFFADAGLQRRPVRTIGVVADITEPRQAEERQRLLLQELNHRVRNMLAIVQAVAALTARSSASLVDFERAIAGRLDALTRTYTLLARAEWRATMVRSLVEEALAPYRAPDGSNVSLTGDDVRLLADMALPLSLVLHELATNAVKHGALSAAGGRVEVDWHVAAGKELPNLLLAWAECGGPEVRPTSRRGFGRNLIERSVAYQLEGAARLEFASEGVRCRIEAPLKGEPEC